MKYIMIFHANLNYAYLTPDRYEFVIRQAYELTIDTLRDHCPNAKYVYEASGYTVEQIAKRTPDVLEKLKDAIKRGQCEFMGSPYSHPMLANFPKEDGLWSLKFSKEVYQKYLDIDPVSFENPECGWRDYIADQILAVGYRHLLGDFEAYSRSCGPDGKPLRPEIYEVEHTDEPSFYNFGFKYDLPGEDRALHFPYNRFAGLNPEQLRVFLRSDRVAQFGVRHFMGMDGYSLDKYMALVKKYSKQKPGEPEGALIVLDDDAEYIGTNGWFKLKYQNKPDNVFEATPESKERLIRLVAECEKLGEFITFDQACSKIPAQDELMTFDNDSAWHGARASTWAKTPMARLLRPWQDLVREKLGQVRNNLDEATLRKAWYHLTNSYNSDGQWPPTLPEAPHIIHPFNYSYCFENLLEAELLVGGIDRNKLTTNPVATLKEILTIQQDLVLKKADQLLASNDTAQHESAREAKSLITSSRDYCSIEASGGKILYPSEYTIRADALAESRRLVSGIDIEKVDHDPKDYQLKNK